MKLIIQILFELKYSPCDGTGDDGNDYNNDNTNYLNDLRFLEKFVFTLV